MKWILRLNKGVTLVEVMLVLVIASLIVVSGIRFYKAASIGSGVTTMMNQLSIITSSADRLSIAKGSYSTVTTSSIATLGGGTKAMTTPYNSAYWVGNTSSTGYFLQVGCIPNSVCIQLQSKLQSNSKFTNISCGACGGCGCTLSYTYNNLS